jgi:uncharacterized protein
MLWEKSRSISTPFGIRVWSVFFWDVLLVRFDDDNSQSGPACGVIVLPMYPAVHPRDVVTSMSAVLAQTEHRPWLLPRKPWLMYMRWTDLAFLHWKMPADALTKHLPNGLELETYDGAAWLGIVPFRMEGVRLRRLPPIPTASTFPELNVRTYVRGGGRAGVWFLSLDALSWLAVKVARAGLNLPYFHAKMRVCNRDAAVDYESRRTHPHAPLAIFRARYEPLDASRHPVPGTLEHWLTERYCLFGQSRSRRVYFMDIHHAPWPLQTAAVRIEQNTMWAPFQTTFDSVKPLVHFARRQDVVTWRRTWL